MKINLYKETDRVKNKEEINVSLTTRLTIPEFQILSTQGVFICLFDKIDAEILYIYIYPKFKDFGYELVSRFLIGHDK